ncbi:helix-turn-helix transcriptional regulator [Streptomyces sp. NBC_00080]|uniref:helix-turn-helix domain-containing protein n=1 Tax=unclassified Streptomyces TaxID=2593676 RepID=UPI001F2F72F5|nr:helix-turn-helix transcriptional regulator [Streptomyces sp. SLBN-115]
MATAALTAREREITLLAAAGNASKDIAKALALSVRTVDNHLHHAYTEPGVTTRRELARPLAAAPPVRARTGGTVPRRTSQNRRGTHGAPSPVPGRSRCRSSLVGALPRFYDGGAGSG